MGKLRNNQKGFGAVEGILILVIVALIGVVGFMAYKNHHKTVSSSTTLTSKSSSTKSVSSNNQNQPANPYADWKQYCDTEGKVCFKYPASWTQNQNTFALSSTVNNVSSTVQSPDQAVNISYDYPYVKDAGNTNFLTMSIDSVPNYPNLKIVGGIYTDTNNLAQYSIVEASQVTQAGLTVGQTSQFTNTPRFGLTSDTTNEPYQFVAIDGQQGNGANTLTAAKNWFSSTEAKQGLLILQSFSTQ